MAYIKKVIATNNSQNPTEAQDRILRGAYYICDAVKQTLGPYGRNFLLEKGLKITNDGLNIAKEITLPDEIEDLGLRIAKEAAIKTADEAGDGTTTALTLTQSILKEIVRLMPGKNLAGKKSIIEIRKQINEEKAEVLKKLKEMATLITSKEELVQVAKVSVEDEKLAELIGSTQWELGSEGNIIPEESNDMEDSIERINGIRWDNGFGTSQVVNNQEKQRLEVENVKVILTNYTFNSDLAPIKNVLDSLVRAGHKKIAIIARAFSPEAIKICIKNHEAGIDVFPLNAPYVNQNEVMEDIASVIGAKYYNEENSNLEDMVIDDVGTAKKLVAYRSSAIIAGERKEVEGAITNTRILERIEKLKKSLKGEESVFLKKSIEARISQLTNGFALLKIGATSDADRKYKYDKAEDAVNAVKSALQEGVVPGAGLATKKIAEDMPDTAILKKALKAPYEQIMTNAGEVFEIPDWVKNSVKVERVALQNACDVALNLATAGGAIASERPKSLDKLFNRQNEEE